jgi:hypothetical protein
MALSSRTGPRAFLDTVKPDKLDGIGVLQHCKEITFQHSGDLNERSGYPENGSEALMFPTHPFNILSQLSNRHTLTLLANI